MKYNNEINPLDVLTVGDGVVFLLVIGLTLLSVVMGHRKRHQLKLEADTSGELTLLDMLIMGRRLTMPMFIATLVSTWYGGILAVTQISFNEGVYNFVTQGVFWYASYVLFAIWLAPRVLRTGAVTLPDMLGTMFGPRAARFSAVFNFVNILPIAYVTSLGMILKLFFDAPLPLLMALGTLFAVLYTAWGGLRSVVYSDLVQFVVMCLAVFLVVLFSFFSFGGIGFLREVLPGSYFNLTGSYDWGTTLVWGFIALSTLVDPNFYQRCFAANSLRTARIGILCSTLIWLGFDLCTTLGGMYARAVIPEADSGLAYLYYGLQLLPPGLRGFFLAGVIATILSTLDSYLFLSGTTLAYDLAPDRVKHRPRFHILGVFVCGVLAVLIATFFKGDFHSIWKTMGSYFTACLLLPVLLGHQFPGKINDRQFVFSACCGVLGTTWWNLYEAPGFWQNVDPLYIGCLSTLLGLCLYPLIDYLDRSSGASEV